MPIHPPLLNKLGFKARIFASFLLLAMPLLLGVSLVLYGFLYNRVRQQTLQEIQETMQVSMAYLEFLIEDAENLSRFVLYSDEVQDGLHDADAGKRGASLASVSTLVNSALAYRDFIDSIVISSRTGPFFSTESATSDIIDFGKIRNAAWYGAESRTEAPFVWVANARRQSGSAPASGNNAMLLRRITSKRDYRTGLGTLMIHLKGPFIDEYLGNIQIGRTVNLWVLDENRNRIFTGGRERVHEDAFRRALADGLFLDGEKGSAVAAVGGVRYAISWSKFRHNDWRIVGIVPFSEVSDQILLIKQQTSIMVVFFAAASLIVAFIIASSISKPIKYLVRTMDTYGNAPGRDPVPPEFRVYQQRQDEIGRIFDAYLRLVGRIDTLFRENYLKEIQKKEAELAALESQINPHFLYNTLDSINWIAMENGQQRISEMVTALADTFRLSLRRTDSPFITVKDELLHVKSYLVIQRQRYGRRLKCRFQVQEGAERLYMLRFLLQPLVENALIHGVDKVSGEARVLVSAAFSPDVLTVSVSNDGAGADLENIGRILDGREIPGTYYGIRNIQRRIKLVHGEACGLSYSLEGERTVCTLTLPNLSSPQGGLEEGREGGKSDA